MNMNPQDTNSELSPRSPWKAFLEVGIFSLVFCAVAVAIMAFPFGTKDLSIVWQRAVTAGSAAIEHIGVTLGVYATTFLAFYGVVLGSQMNRSRMAPQTQRFLSFTSEVLIGSLAPAVILILIGCIAEPSRAGALFALLPAFAILFIVATVLGTFLVFSESERRESLSKARSTLTKRQEELPRAGRWGAPTIVFNAAIFALIGTLITGVFNGWAIQSSVLLLLGSLYFVIAGAIVAVSAFGVISRQTRQDSFDKVSGLIATIIMFAAEAFLISSALFSGLWTVALSLVVTVVLAAVSTRTSSERLRHLTIRGAATKMSTQALAAHLKRINSQLEELNEKS